ncbi:hypothetical protein JCM19274_1202 [Algibacter lectus]|uniref:Uncharacterized protein n=1 Tax=Algibacter lectus TaxID=221126 RepID=A0A090WUA1_9FLAO|nr:hypothetical protein [Algibacter lectus]GAL80576.1 hypothetical protein JCM19274_1202 [Algibacter lectus]
MVLLRSNLPHCWKNHSDASKQSKSIVIQWNKGVYARVPELQPLFRMLTSASRGGYF